MKNKTEVTSQDYRGSNLEKSLDLTVEQTLENNFNKGLIDQDTFDKACIELDILKAGKKAVLGEIRDRKGGRYKKTVNGWEKVTEGNKHGDEDDVDHGKISSDMIDEFMPKEPGKTPSVSHKELTKEVEDYEIHGTNKSLDNIIKLLSLKDSDKSKIATFIKDKAEKKEEKDIDKGEIKNFNKEYILTNFMPEGTTDIKKLSYKGKDKNGFNNFKADDIEFGISDNERKKMLQIDYKKVEQEISKHFIELFKNTTNDEQRSEIYFDNIVETGWLPSSLKNVNDEKYDNEKIIKIMSQVMTKMNFNPDVIIPE